MGKSILVWQASAAARAADERLLALRATEEAATVAHITVEVDRSETRQAAEAVQEQAAKAEAAALLAQEQYRQTRRLEEAAILLKQQAVQEEAAEAVRQLSIQQEAQGQSETDTEAVVRLQANQRGKLARAQVQRQVGYIVRLQSLLRSRIARKKVPAVSEWPVHIVHIDACPNSLIVPPNTVSGQVDRAVRVRPYRLELLQVFDDAPQPVPNCVSTITLVERLTQRMTIQPTFGQLQSVLQTSGYPTHCRITLLC